MGRGASQVRGRDRLLHCSFAGFGLVLHCFMLCSGVSCGFILDLLEFIGVVVLLVCGAREQNSRLILVRFVLNDFVRCVCEDDWEWRKSEGGVDLFVMRPSDGMSNYRIVRHEGLIALGVLVDAVLLNLPSTHSPASVCVHRLDYK